MNPDEKWWESQRWFRRSGTYHRLDEEAGGKIAFACGLEIESAKATEIHSFKDITHNICSQCCIVFVGGET